MPACDEKFRPLLVRFDSLAIDAHAGAVYGLWPDLTLAYMNPAWFHFAAANGGEPSISRDWGLGRSLLDACPEPLTQFYRDRLARCRVSGQPWHHEYDCPSADLERTFLLTVYPLSGGEGLLAVNSLVVQGPHDDRAMPPQVADPLRYADSSGMIHQCMHCRRTCRGAAGQIWDWVPDLVRRLPVNLVHDLCPICQNYHFGARR